ncbi:MAG: sigma-70 family RNA polymerase sigma factor [Ruminococcaceae bacterium]|nr:sigma-70 family RNA polymerase sigma factor [Oscillospiraceae bacterium]
MLMFYLSAIEAPEQKSKFERLYYTYKSLMFYIAKNILADDFLAEDAVHEAFLRILKNLDKIDKVNCHKTKGFIVIVTENISIDLYRKNKRTSTIPLEETEYSPSYPCFDLELLENNIEKAIYALPENYASVLKMKYLLDFDYPEIAGILNISEENVRQRIVRGKKKLAELLAKEDDVIVSL